MAIFITRYFIHVDMNKARLKTTTADSYEFVEFSPIVSCKVKKRSMPIFVDTVPLIIFSVGKEFLHAIFVS